MPADQNSCCNLFSSMKLDAAAYTHVNSKQPIDAVNASAGASPGVDPADGAGARGVGL